MSTSGPTKDPSAGASVSATMYGGQAVIEGVMMRGPRDFAVAARRADGTVAITCEEVPKSLRPAWQKLPFFRGSYALVDSMALGTKALFWAAKVAEAGTTDRKETPSSPSSSKATDIAIGGAMVTGLLMAIGLFKVLPQLLIEPVRIATHWAPWQLGLVDVVVRLCIFTGYISLVARMNHVNRVFMYHGAEHKAINALEHGKDLTVANVQAESRLHPRCGTSFVVLVIVLSVLAVSPFYGLPIWYRIPIQLLMLMPVAGVGFELLRLAGKFRDNPVAAAVSRPGMWTQLLTTREPDDSMVEVAIASLKAVMDAEESRQSTAAPADAVTVS